MVYKGVGNVTFNCISTIMLALKIGKPVEKYFEAGKPVKAW